MKTRKHILLLIFILFAICCKKNEIIENEDNQVEVLKNWLKTNGGVFNNGELNIIENNKIVKILTLDWKKIRNFSYNNVNFTEIPFCFSTNKSIPNTNTIESDPNINSNDSFKIIFQIKDNNQYEVRLLQKFKIVNATETKALNYVNSFTKTNGDQSKIFLFNKFGNYKKEIFKVSNNRNLENCVTFSVPIRQQWCYSSAPMEIVCGMSVVGFNSYTFCEAQSEVQNFNFEDYFNGSGGGGNPSGVAPVPQIIADSIQEPRIKCVFEALMNDSSEFGLASLLAKFQGESGCNVTFKLRDDVALNGALGKTHPIGNGNYEIWINKNQVENSGYSRIWLASTILHEAFHANLLNKVFTTFGETYTNMSAILINDMTLKELVSYVQLSVNGNVSWYHPMHNFMANNIGMLENGIRNFVAQNYPTLFASISSNPNVFRDLAFMGLESYQGFLNIYDSAENLVYLNNLRETINSNCP